MPPNTNQKHHYAWIKFLRILIYVTTIIGVISGINLTKTSTLSISYADNTALIKAELGKKIFVFSLIFLCLNIIWGILRWYKRALAEEWNTKKIIGKLIGGGIWRTLVFTLFILITTIFITPKINQILVQTTNTQIEEPISLSTNFERLQYLNDNLDNINYDNLKDELSELLFLNIDFGNAISTNSNNKQSLSTNSVYAYTPKITMLNKAKLSNRQHFVVFYTDTGDDKITDEQATQIADLLEMIIDGYKTNLGLVYEYTKIESKFDSWGKMTQILSQNDIDINILDTAMPIYVANPYKPGKRTPLATYAGTKFVELKMKIVFHLAELFGEETSKLYNSSFSYPFVNITPQAITNTADIAMAIAHELGHHYSAVYAKNTYQGTCSDDNFIDETTPNWMAINALPNQPKENFINTNHYGKYLSSYTADSINQAGFNNDFGGYPALAFLENYYNIIPNAKTIILDATYYGDALNYLYEHANANDFQKVMITLAEKNLTGNYNGKLINTTTPKGETMGCTDVCTRTFDINPVATEYIYFSTSEYQDVTINFDSNTTNITASVLGQTKDGIWQILKSNYLNPEFEINKNIANTYQVVALAIANSSISEQGTYIVKLAKSDIKNLISDDGQFDFSNYGFTNIATKNNLGCYEMFDIFDIVTDIMGFGGEIIDIFSNTDYYQKEVDNIKTALNEEKNRYADYKITVCLNQIAQNNSFESVKNKIQAAGNTIELFDQQIEGSHFNVSISYDIFSQSGKIFSLIGFDNNLGLITINLDKN